MHMYAAMILSAFALFVWPTENISNVPFSQLTLEMIGKTILFLYVSYWVLRTAFDSLEKDNFWPWRWTRKIVKSLAARAAMLGVLGFASYFILNDTKLGVSIMEYPILLSIALFIAVTTIVCMSDEDLFEAQPVSK